MRNFFFILLIIVSIYGQFNIFNESLWNDRAKDIYNRKVNFTIGESIQILINETSSIEYKSASKFLKTYDFNLSSGELSGLFNFVPKGNAQKTTTGQDRDNTKIILTIQGRITNVTDNYITLRGTKQLTVNNKTGVVAITGDVLLNNISGSTIYSNKLINPTLTITTIVENVNDIFNERDLEKIVLNPDATSDIKVETRLNEQRKRQLLIDYFNKILNVIF